MPGIADLIATIEVELEACQKRAAKTLKERELIITQAQQEGRSNLTEEEDDRIEQLRANHDAEKESEKGIRAKLATANEVKAESDENEKKAREVKSTGVRKPSYDGSPVSARRSGPTAPTPTPTVRVHDGRPPRPIFGRHPWLRTGSPATWLRSGSSGRQYLTRAVGTGAFAGLTVPQYLTDLYAAPLLPCVRSRTLAPSTRYPPTV
jgi:hypothetical protein